MQQTDQRRVFYMVVCPHWKNENLGVEAGVSPLTITPDNLVSVPTTLGSAWSEVLVPKGQTLARGDSKGPTEQ